MYNISDENKVFIARKSGTNNRYVTTNMSEAEIFTTYEKADNVKISLHKSMRVGHNWQVTTAQMDGVNTTYTEVNLEDLKNKINSLAEVMSVMKGNKEYLNDMLSKVDKEIIDILHYIECYNFSASEGYKLARGLKEARERRRKIKDQIAIIKYIDESTGSTIAKGYLSKNIEDLDNRQYTPRVLKELFENKSL